MGRRCAPQILQSWDPDVITSRWPTRLHLHQPTGVFDAPIPWYVRLCVRNANAYQLCGVIASTEAEREL